MMPTLAIEIELSESERQRVIKNALGVANDTSDDVKDYYRETDEGNLKVIGKGLKAEAEGRIIPSDIVLARLKDQFIK